MAEWIGWLALLCALMALAAFVFMIGHRVGRVGRPLPDWVPRSLVVAAGLAVLFAVFYGGIQLGRSGSRPVTPARSGDPRHSAAQDGPVVPVQTVPIRLATLRETISAYGRVIAEPGQTQVISLPFEIQVRHTLVSVGQEVSAGAPLIHVAPSPGSQLLLEQARSAYAAARTEYSQVKQEYKERLAVKTQLAKAQAALRTSRLRLRRLIAEGAGHAATLKASAAGIVSRVDVKEGQLVPAGTPLLELANAGHIQARLGLEPEDLNHVRAGQAVSLHAVHFDPGQVVRGNIRLVTGEIDPSTGLVSVFVSLPAHSPLTLFSYVEGELSAESRHALVVPADAVLPEKDGDIVYTVAHGRAVRHVVRVELDTDQSAAISGGGIKAGEQVVTVGNYELKPGMVVSPQNAS